MWYSRKSGFDGRIKFVDGINSNRSAVNMGIPGNGRKSSTLSPRELLPTIMFVQQRKRPPMLLLRPQDERSDTFRPETRSRTTADISEIGWFIGSILVRLLAVSAI